MTWVAAFVAMWASDTKARPEFFAVAAQVLPVFFLVLAIEGRAFAFTEESLMDERRRFPWVSVLLSVYLASELVALFAVASANMATQSFATAWVMSAIVSMVVFMVSVVVRLNFR